MKTNRFRETQQSQIMQENAYQRPVLQIRLGAKELVLQIRLGTEQPVLQIRLGSEEPVLQIGLGTEEPATGIVDRLWFKRMHF